MIEQRWIIGDWVFNMMKVLM